MSATKSNYLINTLKIPDVCQCTWGELLEHKRSCFLNISLLHWAGANGGSGKLTETSILGTADRIALRENAHNRVAYVGQALAKLYELRERDRLPYVMVMHVPVSRDGQSNIQRFKEIIQKQCEQYRPCGLLKRSPKIVCVCSSSQTSEQNLEAQNALRFAEDADVLIMCKIGQRGYSNDFVKVGVNFVSASEDEGSAHALTQFYGRLLRQIKDDGKTREGLRRTVLATRGCEHERKR